MQRLYNYCLVLAAALLLTVAGVALAQEMNMGMGIGDIPLIQSTGGPPAVIGNLLLVGGGNILLVGGGKLQCVGPC
jgi:hypothetical protein